MIMTEDFIGKELREAMVRAAHTAWLRNIRDTQKGYRGDEKEIAELIKRAGAPWMLNEEGKYKESDDIYWCGAAVAYFGSLVGDHLVEGKCVDVRLNPEIGKYVLPSTYRLSSKAKWKQAGVPMAQEIDKMKIQPGDIVTIYSGRVPKREHLGDHILLATSKVNRGRFSSVEGNTEGWLPGNPNDESTGVWGEGIIKRDHRGAGSKGPRKVEDVRKVYRLGVEHFVGKALDHG